MANSEENKETVEESHQLTEDKSQKRTVKIDSEEAPPVRLQGSPSALLREEDERRKTLEKIREERLSRFEEVRKSRLSRLSQPKLSQPKLSQPKLSQPKLSAAEKKSVKPKKSAPAAAEKEDKEKVAPEMPSIVESLVAPEPRLSSQRASMLTRVSQTRQVSRGPSMMSYRRISLGEDRMKGPKYAPTYRMESKNPFKSSEVYKILREVLELECENKRPYEHNYAERRVMEMAKDVRNAVRSFGYDRYKFCVKVDFGQKLDQGFCSMARFMWDLEKDNFAYAACENMYYFVIISVFAVYYD